MSEGRKPLHEIVDCRIDLQGHGAGSRERFIRRIKGEIKQGLVGARSGVASRENEFDGRRFRPRPCWLIDRMRATISAACLLMSTAVATAGGPVEGTWLTAPGYFEERDVLTIQRVSDHFEVHVHTVFCPTNNECMNARFGDSFFTGMLRANSISTKYEDCEIRVDLAADRATVGIRGCKRDFPYGVRGTHSFGRVRTLKRSTETCHCQGIMVCSKEGAPVESTRGDAGRGSRSFGR